MVSMSLAYWAHTIVCSRTVYSRSSFERSRKGRKRAEGSFFNYIDQILPFIYHLPTYKHCHTRRFDSNFACNSKSYSKFGLPYEDRSALDLDLSWMSNNRSNIIEFPTICRICNHAPISSKWLR